MSGEQGSVKAWVLAFFVTAGVGLGALIGIGCLVNANVCPGSSPAKQTSTDGRALFLANCAYCHGREARGDTGPSLVTGPPAAYTVETLVAKISNGKPLAGMPAFKRSALSQEQIRTIAEYVVSLRGAA